MTPTFDIVRWYETPGWGVQIGELWVRLLALPPGLVINRINLFRQPDGAIGFGPPLVPVGEHAGRHAGFDFPDSADRRRFYELLVELLRAHPELRKRQP
jgi:hypothetical protein